MMTEEDREILNILAVKLKGFFPRARIWAFGSRARGRVEWDADLDICVVLTKINREICQKIRDIAWQAGYEDALSDKCQDIDNPIMPRHRLP